MFSYALKWQISTKTKFFNPIQSKEKTIKATNDEIIEPQGNGLATAAKKSRQIN